MRARHCRSVPVLCACLIAPQLFAADENAQSQARLALMEQAIAALEPSSSQIKSKSALTFVPKPLLRYSDPTRGTTEANVLLDAGVWRLGEQGRPTALVTLEIYRGSATDGLLSYEFLSLSDAPFVLSHREEKKVRWDANSSALKPAALPDAPPPAKTAAGRLSQMRQLVKRFTVREKLRNGEEIVCRLLTQPIDRYQAPDQQLVDGAIFVFANATNPEMGIVLECTVDQWSYGVVRLSAAETTVALDDREVARFPFPDPQGHGKGNYGWNSHGIALPKD